MMALLTTAPVFIIKLFVSLLVGVAAYLRPNFFNLSRYKDLPQLNGVSIEGAFTRQRNSGGYTVFRSEISWLAGVMFELYREKWWDRFFKRRGLATETQIGQTAFDEAYYISCDSPSFKAVLRTSPDVRSAIDSLFLNLSLWISFEDGFLRTHFRGAQLENGAALTAFAKLHQALVAIAPRLIPHDDPYIETVKRIRSFLWALGSYGLGSLFEWLYRARIDLLHFDQFLKLGFEAGVPMLILLCVGFLQYMRDSSRAPRLLVEYGLVLTLLGLPAILGLVADFDRYLDPSRETIVNRLLVSTGVTVTHSKGGQPIYHYSGCFEPAALSPQTDEAAKLHLNPCMPLTTEEYQDMRKGDGVRFHVGNGLFGIPWYKRLERLER